MLRRPRSVADDEPDTGMTPDQKKTNLRTGLILASIALVFFIGFMVKMVVLGR